MSPYRIAAAACALLPGSLAAQTPATRPTARPAAKVVVSKAYYPGNRCLVRDKHIEKDKAVVVQRAGRRVEFCCKKCMTEFDKEPAPHLAKLDRKVIDAQKAAYPLRSCPISGQKLGAMGAPHDIVVGGRLVRLCCPGCEKTARKRAAKIAATIDKALVRAHGNRPGTCPVSGKKIEAGKGVNLIYGSSVVRLCCDRCIAKFDKQPASYMSRRPKKTGRTR